jgi:hypothetical protein
VCSTAENALNCPADCPPICGDGACTGTETPDTCAEDCLVGCGDRICAEDESCSTCPDDCGTCEATQEETILSQTQVEQPSQPDLDSVLGEAGFDIGQIAQAAVAGQLTSVSRTVKVTRHTETGVIRSSVSITVSNTSPNTLANVGVVEKVPKSIAADSSKISSSTIFGVLQEDPIILFTISEIGAGESYTITYSVADEISLSAIADYVPPIVVAATEVTGALSCELMNCDDYNPCTTDVCIDAECFHALVPDETSCGSGNVCRQGVCRKFAAIIPSAEAGTTAEAATAALTIVVIALVLAVIYRRMHKKR